MSNERRSKPRKDLSSTVEFVVEGGSVQEATGIDLSDSGIAFETDAPLLVALTVTVDGEEITRHARLARVSRKPDGGYLFGLEFASK